MAVGAHSHGGLPCGVSLDDLIAQVTEGTATIDRAHQAACRYCEAALDAIAQAWEEFQALARSAVVVPEDLADRIMQRVRAMSRPPVHGIVLESAQGDTAVADRALARLARAEALAVEHVVWASVLEARESESEPGSVVIAVRLVAEYGPDLNAVAERVREQVGAALQTYAGTPVSRVEITVDDVTLGADEIS